MPDVPTLAPNNHAVWLEQVVEGFALQYGSVSEYRIRVPVVLYQIVFFLFRFVRMQSNRQHYH